MYTVFTILQENNHQYPEPYTIGPGERLAISSTGDTPKAALELVGTDMGSP
jgi:hypothetical protein